ncbi:MAG: tRNA pseudouridine(38-40) synthase TruA, partial [Alphaproteobacteria bacterium]|nr:tRNA pseudouridine(38-40) synthase TruA [Alphaproteobacteria bacterium]
AGRTDAGVHATGQVAHIDLPGDFPAEKVRDALNFHMKPEPVAILAAQRVSDDFHARFSAISRAYVYRIANRHTAPVLERGRAWWIRKPLDETAMAKAAARLVGHHDFSTFRAAECQSSSPFKTLDRLEVRRDGDIISIHAGARSFLHHQVRNLTGTLKLVGEGRWTPDDVTRALKACDRRAGGPTAPACGLYLIAVGYEG